MWDLVASCSKVADCNKLNTPTLPCPFSPIEEHTAAMKLAKNNKRPSLEPMLV